MSPVVESCDSSKLLDDAAHTKSSKKQKKLQGARQGHAVLNEWEFARVEEQILAERAEACFLLTGSGILRHVLLVMCPQAVNDVLPTLQTVMGD